MPKKPTPRRIIVFMDGTSNQVGDYQTHVVRMFKAIKRSDTHVIHYIQGVGTAQNQILRDDTSNKIKRWFEFATGLGLEDNVLNGYRFICRTYDWEKYENHKEGSRKTADLRDQISLVGFSRGAYSARVLAGLIAYFGLLHPDDLHLAPQVFRAYRNLRSDDTKAAFQEKLKDLKRYRQVFRPVKPPIQSLILFDTVSSHRNLRDAWKNLRQLRNPFRLDAHAGTTKNNAVRIVLHAVSIDEKRRAFRPLLWEGTKYYGNVFKSGDPIDQKVRQTWFAGYYSDIGGGTREDRSGLAKVSLNWMLDQMKDVGETWDWIEDKHWEQEHVRGTSQDRRRTVDGRPKAKVDYGGHIHNSMTTFWGLVECLPKRGHHTGFYDQNGLLYVARANPRKIPADQPIHPSVFDRRNDGRRAYHPVNIAHRAPKDNDPDDPALRNTAYTSKSARGGDT